MTEKRFTCHQMIADYSTGEDIDFDFLQELIDEQEQPKDLRMHISDGNKIITYRECVDLLNELVEENERLNEKNQELFDDLQNKTSWLSLRGGELAILKRENEQLKQSSTMYYNLFKELQRQMQGVKSMYDLDSKDFEDLIELSKGNVFDDEFGWLHLPIEELQE